MVCRLEQSKDTRQPEAILGASQVCIPTPARLLFGDGQMKQIPLTKGQFALIENEDYEELTKHKWYAAENHYGGFRAVREAANRTIYMHREILDIGYGDKLQVDHINHNTLDNRRVNLRLCNNRDNSRNRKSQKNSSSKYKGVTWCKRTRKWATQIKLREGNRFLGYFNSEIKAALAYDAKAKELFGEFSNLNF